MTSDELVEALRNRHGVEPLSHEFIFSPTLAKARNAAIVGSGPRRTVLSVLLYDLMTEAQRSQLYGGKFDLGSSLVVSREEQTYDELLGEIERGDRSAKDYEQQGIDAFKTIKAGILKMSFSCMGLVSYLVFLLYPIAAIEDDLLIQLITLPHTI